RPRSAYPSGDETEPSRRWSGRARSPGSTRRGKGMSDTFSAAGAVTFPWKGDLPAPNAHRVKLVKPRERGDRRDERAEWHGSIGIGSVIVEVDRGARTRLRE